MKSGHPESRRRLETQVLHFDGQDWRGYTYAWNDAQTDADLVAAEGMDRTLVVDDPRAPGGRREQTWHFPSRAECLTCHNSWSGYRLSFNPLQLGKDHAGVDQLESFQALGLLSAPKGGIEGRTTDGGKPAQKLTNPYDPSASLDERARSYLQVNCAHCHQFGGGGTANISLRYDTPLEQTLILDVRPSQGTFGIYDARIVAHGDPYRSVLFYRMAKLGPGRMPRIGSDLLDEDGLRLMRDWIAQGPPGRSRSPPTPGGSPRIPPPRRASRGWPRGLPRLVRRRSRSCWAPPEAHCDWHAPWGMPRGPRASGRKSSPRRRPTPMARCATSSSRMSRHPTGSSDWATPSDRGNSSPSRGTPRAGRSSSSTRPACRARTATRSPAVAARSAPT